MNGPIPTIIDIFRLTAWSKLSRRSSIAGPLRSFARKSRPAGAAISVDRPIRRQASCSGRVRFQIHAILVRCQLSVVQSPETNDPLRS